MSGGYMNFGIFIAEVVRSVTVLGLASSPFLAYYFCTAIFKSYPHYLPTPYHKPATYAIVGIVQLANFFFVPCIPDIADGVHRGTALFKRSGSSAAAEVHWSTYLWGTLTGLVGIFASYTNGAGLRLNQKRWAAEEPNLAAQKTNLATERANLRAERANLDTERTNLEKERANLVTERANLVRERAELKARKIVTLNEVERMINHRLNPIKADISHLQKAVTERD